MPGNDSKDTSIESIARKLRHCFANSAIKDEKQFGSLIKQLNESELGELIVYLAFGNSSGDISTLQHLLDKGCFAKPTEEALLEKYIIILQRALVNAVNNLNLTAIKFLLNFGEDVYTESFLHAAFIQAAKVIADCDKWLEGYALSRGTSRFDSSLLATSLQGIRRIYRNAYENDVEISNLITAAKMKMREKSLSLSVTATATLAATVASSMPMLSDAKNSATKNKTASSSATVTAAATVAVTTLVHK